MNQRKNFAVTVRKDGLLAPEEGLLKFLAAETPDSHLTLSVRQHPTREAFEAEIVITHPDKATGKHGQTKPPKQFARFARR